MAEVYSPSDRMAEFNEKIQMWLDFGVRLVLALYLQTHTIAMHQPGRPMFTLSYGDTLEGGDAIPGFSCPVRDIFDL